MPLDRDKSWSLWGRSCWALIRTAVLTILCQLPVELPLPAPAQTVQILQVSVTDTKQAPVAGAVVSVQNSKGVITKAVTDEHGKVTVSCDSAAPCVLTASKDGFLEVAATIESSQSQTETTVTLAPVLADKQTVVVQGKTDNPVAESNGIEATLQTEDAVSSPLRPATLIDALPLIPGVIRTTDGRVQISGMDEQHSTLIINFVDVSDPATGSFGLSVPVDTVDVMKVSQSPYLAQYGNFTAGVVSAQTRRGGDKWKYDLNDPLPEFRIRSGHLRGLRSATPRFNVSGPISVNRLYFLEGTEYLMNKTSVRTLPFPENETKSDAVNSFTQIDAPVGTKHSFTATLHFAPHNLRYANLNYFDPRPVTPNADYQEDTGTVTHRLALGEGVLASTFAMTRVATNIGTQGTAPMTLSPVGNSGNYFGTQMHEATRFQWIETWNPAPLHWHGKHALQIGSVLAHSEDDGQVLGNNLVNIQDADGHLLKTIAWKEKKPFLLTDFEPAGYIQDHWTMGSRFAVDAGMRAETQTLTYTSRFAPRTGFTWTPGESGSTVLRGGIGVFYDAVPLGTYAFSSNPKQIITTYDGNGNIVDGPRVYSNVTSTSSNSNFPFLHTSNRAGNFAPYSVAWNVAGEHSFHSFLTLGLRFLDQTANNQLVLTQVTSTTRNALVLSGTGTIRSRQLDFTARAGSSSQRQVYFSYVRQFAHGDQSDATTYLGDFPFPVVRTPVQASTAGEIPNRFLVWGNSNLPWRMRIDPRVEYRNGFSWQPTDVYQNYVSLAGLPQPRFPKYFSADSSLAKDMNISPKHAIRLTFTVRNLTNHTNALQVHNNMSDPLYGRFFGNYGRHLLMDFDFLF